MSLTTYYTAIAILHNFIQYFGIAGVIQLFYHCGAETSIL